MFLNRMPLLEDLGRGKHKDVKAGVYKWFRVEVGFRDKGGFRVGEFQG